MADLIFVGQFITSKAGATGLTVTVDIDRYTISDGSRLALVTGGSATEGRRGLYHYRLASADLSLYQYVATFITSDTGVDQQEMAALGLVVPDALVSSRLAPSTANRTLAVDASGNVDLVDAPNATAVAAIATKTLTTLIIPNLVSGSLAEYVYDTKIASGYGYIINNAIGAWTGTGVNTVLGAFKALLSKTASTPSDIGGTFDPATDSTEALRDRGDAAWLTADVSGLATSAALATVDGNVDAIKAKTDNLPTDPADESLLEAAISAAVSGLSTLDAAGVRTAVGLATANLDTQLAALPTDADVQTAATAALNAYDPPTNAEMVARTLAAASYFDPAADTVAHVTLVDTTTTNTDMVSAAPSAAAIRAEIDANSTQLAAIVADTNELQTNQGNWATADVSSLATAAELAKVPKSDGSVSWNATALAAINAQADTALADYDPPTHAELLSALSGGISVEVDAQTIADAMAVATTDTPAANSVLDRLVNIQSTTDQIDLTDINYVSNIQSGTLNMTRGVTFEQEITGVTIPSDWASIVLRCKRKADTIDGQDQIAIVVTNPSAVSDGLTVLGGTAVASPITKADGSLTIDQPGSSITIMVSDEATDELGITANGIWDVKITDGGGDTVQRARGVFNLTLI